jgi:hypothetical protein
MAWMLARPAAIAAMPSLIASLRSGLYGEEGPLICNVAAAFWREAANDAGPAELGEQRSKAQMRRWSLRHYAVSSFVAASLLAGCGALPLSSSKGQGDMQPPIGAPGATLQTRQASALPLRYVHAASATASTRASATRPGSSARSRRSSTPLR